MLDSVLIVILDFVAVVSVKAYRTEEQSAAEDSSIFMTRALDNSVDVYQIEFAVKDTGIGIPSDRLNRLFKSFSLILLVFWAVFCPMVDVLFSFNILLTCSLLNLIPVAFSKCSDNLDAVHLPNSYSYSSGSFSIVDFSVLESICEMAGEEANLLIEEMITTYLADTEVRLQAIAEAINQADAEIIEQAAHSMKSSSANLGAVNLAQLCEELEQLGRAKKIDNTKPLLSNAQVEFQQVHQDLYSFIKTMNQE